MNKTNDDVVALYPSVFYRGDNLPPSSYRLTRWMQLRTSEHFKDFLGDKEFQTILSVANHCGTDEAAEFTAYMCLAYWSLKPEQRRARQDIVDSAFKKYLPPDMKTTGNETTAPSEKVNKEVDRLRLCLAALTPQALLKRDAMRCATHARRARANEFLEMIREKKRVDFNRIEGWASFAIIYNLATQDLPQNLYDHSLHTNVLGWGFITITDVEEAELFANAVLTLRKQAGQPVLQFLHKRWLEMREHLFAAEPVLVDCVIDGAATNAPPQDCMVMLGARLDLELRADFMERSASFHEAEVVAREKKVKFGSVATPVIEGALKLLDDTQARINAGMRKHLTRKPIAPKVTAHTTTTTTTITTAHTANTAPTTDPGTSKGRGRGANSGRKPTTQQTAKVVAKPEDPVVEEEARERERFAGWSVDWLVRWIDGPLPEPSQSTKAPNVNAVTHDQKAGAKIIDKEDVASTAESQVSPVKGSVESDSAEIHAIVLAGLRASAEFMLADMQAMRELAKRFIEPFTANEAASVDDLVKELAALKDEKDGSTINEVAARDLFARAEHSMTDLRARVRHGEAEQVVLDRFANGVSEALKTERVEIGRSIGGSFQIAGEKNPLAHWPVIANKFHGRVLALDHVFEGDIQRRLQPNEALALYVTCGSQSGAEFCVSVHLWRRRPSSSTPPSLSEDLKMDTENWYDTYIPCCVLHVKPG